MGRKQRAKMPRQNELPLGMFRRPPQIHELAELSPEKERELRLALAELLTAAAIAAKKASDGQGEDK